MKEDLSSFGTPVEDLSEFGEPEAAPSSSTPRFAAELMQEPRQRTSLDPIRTPIERAPQQRSEAGVPSEQVAAINQWFDSYQQLTDDPAKRAAMESARKAQIEKLGVSVVKEAPLPTETVGRFVGPAVQGGVKVSQAAATDLAKFTWKTLGGDVTSPDLENLTAYALDPKDPLPIQEQTAKIKERWKRVASYIGLAAAAAPVYVGSAAGLGMLGMPAPVANALTMGFDQDGKMDPVGVAAAIGLPVADSAGRKLTADALTKVLDKVKVVRTELIDEPGRYAVKIMNKGLLKGLDHDAVLKALEIGGGQLANNAYLMALQTPGILSSEDPKSAMEQAVAQNVAMALMGMPELKAGGKSITYQTLKDRFAKGEWPKVETKNQPQAQIGAPTTEPAAEPAPANEPPTTPAAPAAPVGTQEPTSAGREQLLSNPLQLPAATAPTPPPVATPVASSPQPISDPGVVLGKPTMVRGQANLQLPAFYAWVPVNQIHGSHEGEQFTANPAYAPLKNTRDYETSVADREKVLEGAAQWDPHSYATNVRSAADGPIMISRGQDGVYRVLGGNGRFQMIQRLSEDQRQQFGEVQDAEAAAFGLPVRPDPSSLLVRLLPPTDLASETGLAAASRIVDGLNPSPGLVETTAGMARNDAPKIDAQALSGLPAEVKAATARDFLQTQIGLGVIDRNTRNQILSSDSQVIDYVERVALNRAYGDQSLIDAAQDPKTPAATRALIKAPAGFLISVRQQGQPLVANAVSELAQRVLHYQAQGQKLDAALKQTYSQEEGWPTPELRVARNLAAVMATKVERLAPNKRGERKIDADETARNFEDLFSRLRAAVMGADNVPDIFGNTRTPLDAINDFLRSQLGDQPINLHDSATEPPSADPRVQRLNQLTERARDRKLTAAEEAERASLEKSLGQKFMTFWTEATAKQQASEDLAGLKIRAGQQRRLVGEQIATQQDMFGLPPEDSGGQLTFFEGRRKQRYEPRQLELNLTQVAQSPIQGRELPAPGSAGRDSWHYRARTRLSSWKVAQTLLRQELIQAGKIDIVGRQARNIDEVAALLQVFRQPQFEVFHWVLMRGDQVVGRHSVSVRVPGMTVPFVGGYKQGIQDMRAKMMAVGATGYYIAHNHPSGVPSPSKGDIEATVELAKVLPGFLGHVVTDHDQYGFIRANGAHGVEHLVDVDGPDPLLAAPSGPLGRRVDSPQAIAGLQKELAGTSRGEVVRVLMTSRRLVTRSLIDINASDLLDTGFERDLFELAVEHGTPNAVVYYEGGDHKVVDRIQQLVDKGVLLDAILVGPSGRMENLRASAPREYDHFSTVGVPEELAQLRATTLYEGPPREHEPQPPTYEFTPEPRMGKKGKVPTEPVVAQKLGHMDLVRPVEMPELVKLARGLLGHVPQVRRLPKSHGVMTSVAGGEATIKLSPQIFVDPQFAARVLAHEIGHLIDFLDQRTLSRGNLFGRIASLRQWLKTTFPATSAVDIKNVITTADRQRLRRKAEEKVGPRPPADEEADLAAWRSEVALRYGELVEEEIETRNLVKLEELRAEVWALSAEWRPVPENAPDSYLDYRKSSVEMYADALSAMLNSPGWVEENAPIFYRMFWDFLDRKPEVKTTLFDLQDFLAKGKIKTLEQRAVDIQEMFKRGEDKMRAAADARIQRRNSWRGLWVDLGIEIVDRNLGVILKAKASGDTRTLEIIDRLGLRDNVNLAWVRRTFEHVVKPVEDAGLTIGDIGQWLFLERVIAGDRKEMANPLGMTPLAARQQMLYYRQSIGPAETEVLRRAVARFHSEVYAVVKRAVDVGVYNHRTFKETIEPNKDTYAAFAVVDYLEDFVPPSIRQSMGTFKDVANPLVSTVYKVVALNNLIAHQEAVTATRDMLQKHFPGEILPAEEAGPVGARRPKTHPDYGVLTRLENGHAQHWYVDPAIAKAFDIIPPTQLGPIVRLLDVGFRQVLYPMLITYNPGFLFVVSPIREVMRTGRNMPILFGRLRLLREYGRVWSEVVRRYKGLPGPLTREMEATFAIAPPFENVTNLHRSDAFGRMMERYEMVAERVVPEEDTFPMPAPVRRVLRATTNAVSNSRLAAPVRRVGHFIAFWGQVLDSLPKYGAYQILRRDLRMPPAEAGAWVRSYAGLSNIRNRGRSIQLIRSLDNFWNVFMQGWRADIRLMTQPKTRSGYWFRWAAGNGWMTVLKAAVASGMLGGALKAWWDGVSEYDKTNYTILPIGRRPGGEFGSRVAYIRVPLDETDRLLSGMVYKAIRSLAGASLKGNMAQDIGDMLSFGSGQVPGLNPMITLADRWADYVRNVQPLDPSTGRPIVPNLQWKAGGIDALLPMANWTLGQARLNIWSTQDKPEGTLELAAQVAPIVSRLVRVTDYGYKEGQAADQAARDKIDAKRRLSYGAEVQSLVAEHGHLQGLGAANRTETQQLRYLELAPFINAIYKPADEMIEQLEEQHDRSGANALRAQLKELAQPFKRR